MLRKNPVRHFVCRLSANPILSLPPSPIHGIDKKAHKKSRKRESGRNENEDTGEGKGSSSPVGTAHSPIPWILQIHTVNRRLSR